jgi:hypothetical protein
LLKSSSPSKVEIQALLQDKDLVSKFSSDVRKYSHNYEGSLFFENYNFGMYNYVCMYVYVCVCVCVCMWRGGCPVPVRVCISLQ